MEPRIVVVSGGRVGETLPLPSGEFAIGRDSACHLSIDEEFVSRRHCIVTLKGGTAAVQDSETATGTLLNGNTLTGRRVLTSGDRIEIGESELVFLTGPDSELGDPPAFFDETSVAPGGDDDYPNALLDIMVRYAFTIRDHRREAEMVRKLLLSFISTIVPADRAAILLADAEGRKFEIVAVRDRQYPLKSVRIRRSIIERVYQGRTPICTPSHLCVRMNAFKGKIGVLYAECSDPEAGFTVDHLHHFRGVATVTAITLENSASIQRLETKVAGLEKDLHVQRKLIGQSAAMLQLNSDILRTARANSTVLIQGESGTGKDLVAHAIHDHSSRADGPFKPINCAAIGEGVVESELFGHEKGAFTGATDQKKGNIELASGGTLFLDEIGELPLATQAKLLRVLEERELQRVGGTKTIKVDIRVIAATNRELDAAVKKGTFRLDLYHRLNVFTITTPALRDRKEDISILAAHFLARYSEEIGRPVRGIAEDASRLLENYSWPGNVRELRNAIERAVGMGSADVLLPEDLPVDIQESANTAIDFDPLNYTARLNALKRDLLMQAFTQANGNSKSAAALLNLNPTYVYRLLDNMKLTHLRKSN